MRLGILVVACFLLVAWLAYSAKPPNSLEQETTPPRTVFVLGQWYCCLLDNHPVRVSKQPEPGGFGGRSGRPVTE